ncbi:MAG: hypothetical protein KAQ91_02600 [Methylococcales bacterium]|nr:hypothetical protein [Methylococcales bacterium]
MLHIINNFPIPMAFLDHTHAGDSIIFTDNAVLAVKQENSEPETLPHKTLSHINVYVRKVDLLMRNISNSDLLQGVVVIDERQFQKAIYQDFAIKSLN